MEAQEVYKISGNAKNVTITHKKGLDELRPLQIKVLGNIDTVTRWIAKRHNTGVVDSHYVNPNTSFIVINREEMFISLRNNEGDPLYESFIVGKLEFHPDYEKWRINTSSEFNSQSLADFVKMNRSCFVNVSDAMKLSSELQNLKVKVDKEIEKSTDNRANVKQLLAQNVIEMNIPKTFKLCVPIFKGQDKVTFEVEIYVNANNFQISFISPEVNDLIHLVKNTIIDEQIAVISEVAPGIVIIEQ